MLKMLYCFRCYFELMVFGQKQDKGKQNAYYHDGTLLRLWETEFVVFILICFVLLQLVHFESTTSLISYLYVL